jgi:hypothetical protein
MYLPRRARRCSCSGAETVPIRLDVGTRFGQYVPMCRCVPTSGHPNASIVFPLAPCLCLHTHTYSFTRPELDATTARCHYCSMPLLLAARWPQTSSYGLMNDAYALHRILVQQHETRVTWLHLWLPELEVRRGPDLTCVYDAFVTCLQCMLSKPSPTKVYLLSHSRVCISAHAKKHYAVI